MDTLNVPYEEVLKKHKDDFKERWNNPADECTPCLNDFIMFDRVIGTGSFSTVKVAKDKKTGKLYALKIMKKGFISQLQKIQNVINEKRILQAIKFPFIVDLHFSFKDNTYLYLGLEFAKGGDFFKLVVDNNLQEKDFPFYISQITLALEYLHSIRIIYRDLKPENILVGLDGYIKLCDFGLAKVGDEPTKGVLGTLSYLASEVLRGENHSPAMDWWSLGVIMIYCIAKRDPFRVFYNTNSRKENIMDGIYITPDFFTQNLKDLVKQLLQYDPVKRISSPGIKVHPWFDELRWNDIYLKKISAPLTPVYNTNQTVDFRNFDNKDPVFHIVAHHNQLKHLFEDF